MRIVRTVFYCFIFSVIFFLSQINRHDAIAPIVVIWLFSFLYFVYFIISEGLWAEIMSNVIVSLILVVLSALFPPLAILLFLWVLSNLVSAFKGMKSLLPSLIFSLCIALLLFDELFSIPKDYTNAIVFNVMYFVFAFIYSVINSKFPLKTGVMRLSIMLISAPLMLITISSIVSGLQNLFSVRLSYANKNIQIPQNVSSHMRGDTVVNSYTRTVTKSVSDIVSTTTIGTGGIMIGAAASIPKSINSENKDEQNTY